MAKEYYLMCTSCKEFINLYKFPILLGSSPTGIHGIPIGHFNVEELIKQANVNDLDHKWIFDLRPFITAFVDKHLAHQLRIVDDYAAGYYWWPEHKGYAGWKEMQTSLVNELFLPRNLIEDLEIKNWDLAEAHLKRLKVVLYEELEMQEYRSVFEQVLRERGNET